jgi:predicted nucleic-acid-binding Zn-ribbon protein
MTSIGYIDARTEEERVRDFRTMVNRSIQKNLYLMNALKYPFSESGTLSIGTGTSCPKCRGNRRRWYSSVWNESAQEYRTEDYILCLVCGYTEHKQPDGSYAPLTPFDETKLQDRVNWWAD